MRSLLSRLRERQEWQLGVAIWRADPKLAAAWWVLVLARGLLPAERGRVGVDAASPDQLASLFDDVKPTVVINCAGIVKQRTDVGDAEMIRANALLPHRLADA